MHRGVGIHHENTLGAYGGRARELKGRELAGSPALDDLTEADRAIVRLGHRIHLNHLLLWNGYYCVGWIAGRACR
jgi:hypothetical protein